MSGIIRGVEGTPSPYTKAWYDAQHNPPQPKLYGFPGAGILAIAAIILCMFTVAFTLYSQGKIAGRHECFRFYNNGMDY